MCWIFLVGGWEKRVYFIFEGLLFDRKLGWSFLFLGSVERQLLLLIYIYVVTNENIIIKEIWIFYFYLWDWQFFWLYLKYLLRFLSFSRFIALERWSVAPKFAWRKAQFLVRYLLFYWKNLDVWVGDRMMFWGWILGLFWVCFAVCWYNFLWLGLTIRYRRKHFFLRWLIIKF